MSQTNAHHNDSYVVSAGLLKLDPSGLAVTGYPDGMSAQRRHGDEPARDERARTTSDAPRRSGLSPAAAQLLALQGTAGNRAVCRALSADGRGTTDLVADERDAGAGSAAPAAAATPIAVRNGPGHVPIDTTDAAGMAIDITLTSSSGVDADMAAILDSEQVGTSVNHTGSYTKEPSRRSSNSGYMTGHPIPADRHSESKAEIIRIADANGGAGSYEREQLDTWKPNASGTAAAIPASGYFIRRLIIVAGTGIRLRTEKGPRAVTVNGFTTTAGPSALQFEEVEVRAPAPAPAPAPKTGTP